MKNLASKNNIEDDILRKIMTLSKVLKEDYDKRLASYNLTSTQSRCLVYIIKETARGNTIHQNDIGKKFDLSKSTISELLDRLEKKELIKRTIAKPYTSIEPSDKCMGIVKEIHKHRHDTLDKLLTGFDKKDQDNLTNILDKLLANMKEGDEECSIK